MASKMSYMVGKLTVMSQLATHCAMVATDRAAARILFGNDSPSSTQTTPRVLDVSGLSGAAG